MKTEHVLQKLRSQSSQAVKEALVSLARGKLEGELPEEIRSEIVTIFGQGSSPDENLVTIVCLNPHPDFAGLIERMLSQGPPHQQAQVLGSLDQWKGKGYQLTLESLKPMIETLSESEDPWVAFLATMQRVHLFGEEPERWELGAKSIKKADEMQWWQSIRPQVTEFIELDRLNDAEISLINKHLENLGSEKLIKNRDLHENLPGRIFRRNKIDDM